METQQICGHKKLCLSLLQPKANWDALITGTDTNFPLLFINDSIPYQTIVSFESFTTYILVRVKISKHVYSKE